MFRGRALLLSVLGRQRGVVLGEIAMQLCCRHKLSRRPLWLTKLKSDVVKLSFLPGIITNETLTLMTHKAELFRHQFLSTSPCASI